MCLKTPLFVYGKEKGFILDRNILTLRSEKNEFTYIRFFGQ